jgi:Tfp pilus assembly protein PilF
MSPWNPQPYLILAAVYIQKDSLQQAAEMCRRALIINPDAPDAHYNLACIHALQGNPAHALESLELALKHGFEDEELIRKDADLETLRGTVAFEALLAKFK